MTTNLLCSLTLTELTSFIGVGLAVMSSLMTAIGVWLALHRWKSEFAIKRAEVVWKFIEKIRSDSSISSVLYMLDYTRGWYTQSFHYDNITQEGETSQTLENKIDRTLSYFSYLCFLQKNKILKKDDFDFFEYHIVRIFKNPDIQNYLYNLYHFSQKQGCKMSFEYLFQYGETLKMIPKDFYDKNNIKYKHYLNF